MFTNSTQHLKSSLASAHSSDQTSVPVMPDIELKNCLKNSNVSMYKLYGKV